MVRRIYIGSRNQYAVIVDDCDYDYLMQWKWTFMFSHCRSKTGLYARRCARINGEKKTIMMHTVILERKTGEKFKSRSEGKSADHKNRDTLNNTRENLRWATNEQQARNRRPRWKDHSKPSKSIDTLIDVPF